MSATNPDLKLALIQAELVWSNPASNLDHLAKLMESVEADVIVLPEMFTTGFNMQPQEVAEVFVPHGDTPSWMRQQARTKNALVMGSVAMQSGDRYFNRLLVADPDGNMYDYDKRHLFSFAGENREFTAGQKRLVVEWKGWRICPLICYDLRFPVWSRNTLVDGRPAYDLLVYVANWPEARVHAWTDLLKARAHENAAYVAGCNRVGTDDNGIVYNGQSAILNMKGAPQVQSVSGESVLEATLSWEDLAAFRAKFPVLEDGDDFSIG